MKLQLPVWKLSHVTLHNDDVLSLTTLISDNVSFQRVIQLSKWTHSNRSTHWRYSRRLRCQFSELIMPPDVYRRRSVLVLFFFDTQTLISQTPSCASPKVYQWFGP